MKSAVLFCNNSFNFQAFFKQIFSISHGVSIITDCILLLWNKTLKKQSAYPALSWPFILKKSVVFFLWKSYLNKVSKKFVGQSFSSNNSLSTDTCTSMSWHIFKQYTSPWTIITDLHESHSPLYFSGTLHYNNYTVNL